MNSEKYIGHLALEIADILAGSQSASVRAWLFA